MRTESQKRHAPTTEGFAPVPPEASRNVPSVGIRDRDCLFWHDGPLVWVSRDSEGRPHLACVVDFAPAPDRLPLGWDAPAAEVDDIAVIPLRGDEADALRDGRTAYNSAILRAAASGGARVLRVASGGGAPGGEALLGARWADPEETRGFAGSPEAEMSHLRPEPPRPDGLPPPAWMGR